jgi:15-cis-phytoene desaturase
MSSMKELEVVIIGGGLSGLACAADLAEAGKQVLVLEARSVPGGRTASWREDDGLMVESGFHRFLGFYTELPALLQKAGVDLDKMLCWEDELEIILPDDGPRGLFGASPLHKPLKSLAGALGNTDFLSLKEKAKLGRFFLAGLKRLREDPAALDTISVAQLARQHRLQDATIHKMLVPFTEGIFFLPPQEHSAYVLFQLIELALKRPQRMRIGAFNGGMTDVMINPICRYLEDQSVEIVVNTAVQQLRTGQSGKWCIDTEWNTIECRQVVVATSLGAAQRLLRPEFSAHSWFQPMLTLPSHTAVTLQLELDRPAMEVDRTTFAPGTVLSSFAEQSRTTFQDSAGRLSVILAQPDIRLHQTPEELLHLVLDDARRLNLDIGNVIKYRKIAHPEDFYRLAPGMEQKRPQQQTPIPGLYLAGDYTKQPFMATMEGAVISGKRAAQALLQSQKR